MIIDAIITRHRASTEHSLTFRVRTTLSHREVEARWRLVGWSFRDEGKIVTTVRVMLPP